MSMKQFLMPIGKQKVIATHVDVKLIADNIIDELKETGTKCKYYIPKKENVLDGVMPEKYSRTNKKSNADVIVTFKRSEWISGYDICMIEKSSVDSHDIEIIEDMIGCKLDDVFYVSNNIKLPIRGLKHSLYYYSHTMTMADDSGKDAIFFGNMVGVNKNGATFGDLETVKTMMRLISSDQIENVNLGTRLLFNMNLRTGSVYEKMFAVLSMPLIYNSYSYMYIRELVSCMCNTPEYNFVIGNSSRRYLREGTKDPILCVPERNVYINYECMNPDIDSMKKLYTEKLKYIAPDISEKDFNDFSEYIDSMYDPLIPQIKAYVNDENNYYTRPDGRKFIQYKVFRANY